MYDNLEQINYGGDPQSMILRMNAVMRRVFGKMTLALLVTALTSWLCLGSETYWSLITAHRYGFLVLFVAELGLVIALSSALNRMSTLTASLLFYAFAVVNGLALTPIFAVFTSASIAKTFVICAATFGAMATFGYLTKQDLTSFGRLLFFALLGLIIASVVNIFMGSSMLELVISGVGVLIFIGLTAWDTQKIKQMAYMYPESATGKLATIGALSLYLDFINLFLYLLRFFGRRE